MKKYSLFRWLLGYVWLLCTFVNSSFNIIKLLYGGRRVKCHENDELISFMY